jgi:hypothetical protein
MWPIMPALGHHAVLVEVAAVEVGVGDDGAARHLVEGDVLRRQVGRRGHRDAMAHTLRMAQRPRQRLHAAQAAAEHGRQLRDAQPREQPRLRVDPVLDREHRKARAPGVAGGRVDVHRPGRAEARAGVVDADDEEALGIQRLARADQVVPPACAVRPPGVLPGNVVAGVERVAHEYRVAAVSVQGAVGLVDEVVACEHGAALQRQGLAETHLLRGDQTKGCHERTRRRKSE